MSSDVEHALNGVILLVLIWLLLRVPFALLGVDQAYVQQTRKTIKGTVRFIVRGIKRSTAWLHEVGLGQGEALVMLFQRLFQHRNEMMAKNTEIAVVNNLLAAVLYGE